VNAYKLIDYSIHQIISYIDTTSFTRILATLHIYICMIYIHYDTNIHTYILRHKHTYIHTHSYMYIHTLMATHTHMATYTDTKLQITTYN